MKEQTQDKRIIRLAIVLLSFIVLLITASGAYAPSTVEASSVYTGKSQLYYQGRICTAITRDTNFTREEFRQISSKSGFQQKVATKAQILIIDEKSNRLLKQVQQVQVSDSTYSQIKSDVSRSSNSISKHITVGIKNDNNTVNSMVMKVNIGSGSTGSTPPPAGNTTSPSKNNPGSGSGSGSVKNPGPSANTKKDNKSTEKKKKKSKASSSLKKKDTETASNGFTAETPLAFGGINGQPGMTADGATPEGSSGFVASISPIYADSAQLLEDEAFNPGFAGGNLMWLVLLHVVGLSIILFIIKRKRIFSWLKQKKLEVVE